jgi:hypothetical protein
LKVKVPLVDFFNFPTIETLSEYIDKNCRENVFFTIKPAEKKQYYPVSSAQNRIFIVQAMDLLSTFNNLPSIFRVKGDLSKEKLENALKNFILRHDSLRTAFAIVNDEPVQRIHDQVECKIEIYDEAKGKEQGARSRLEHMVKDFVKPFNLSEAPLFRLRLIKEQEKVYILMLDAHHIISDGTSTYLFQKELMALYQEKKLPPLKIQYKDYSEWQYKQMETETIWQQEEYWLKQFEKDIPPPIRFPEYDGAKQLSIQGDSVNFELGEATTRQLKRITSESDTTLFMVLLAVYYILLSKYSGQSDILVGIPIAGRRHLDLQNIIGIFVNMLVLRNFPQKEKRFSDFLQEIK